MPTAKTAMLPAYNATGLKSFRRSLLDDGSCWCPAAVEPTSLSFNATRSKPAKVRLAHRECIHGYFINTLNIHVRARRAKGIMGALLLTRCSAEVSSRKLKGFRRSNTP